MPLLTIRTNQSLSIEAQQRFLSHASSTIAKLLNKPESYVMILLQTEQALIFAGNDAPCGLLELKSLGLAEDKTTDLSKSLCQMINQQLQIPTSRIYIEFNNAERHLWGWDNGTF